MKIVFNLINVGAGNNGGTLTIYNSANTLHDLGHEVIIVDSMPNKHTWTNLKCERMIIKKSKQFPESDAIIATGFKSVDSTLSIKSNALKMHWIRAYETWVYNEVNINKKVLKPSTIKLVNSIDLQIKLYKFGHKSHIVRPGYDIDLLYPEANTSKRKNIIIGGLYREGIHGKRKRTNWIFEAFDKLKNNYPIELWMFGSEKKPDNNKIKNYLRSPNINEKRKFLNMIDIWIAPTVSEGLHMPPAEAMLCEKPVVGTNAPLSGMKDYLIHEKTGLVGYNNMEDFLQNIERLIRNKLERKSFGKNGRKQILSLGTRKDNMNKLVNLISKLSEK